MMKAGKISRRQLNGTFFPNKNSVILRPEKLRDEIRDIKNEALLRQGFGGQWWVVLESNQ